MTLVTRLSLFYLTMLSVVLLGFSIGLYAMAERYLYRQLDERLSSSLNAIGNIIETGNEAVEWEPGRRTLELASTEDFGQVVWLVTNDEGKVLDRSTSQNMERFLEDAKPNFELKDQTGPNGLWTGNSWKAGQRWIYPESGLFDHDSEAPSAAHTYRALSVIVGVSLAPVRTTLSNLANSLIGLSLCIGVIALVAGRFVCRRALLPVQQMSTAVTEVCTDDFSRRLPVLTTDDELGNLNRAFNQLLDRLQDAFERQKRFTGDASHQLRTPLTAIQGQIEVALRRERSADDYRQVLEKVQKRTSHLSGMTEALLFLARADAEAKVPKFEPILLNEWLPKHLETWSEHARYGDMKFEEAGLETCTINAQPSLLAELLNILLDNACKYSDPETPIFLRLWHDEATTSISVEDNGYGIPTAEIANVFVPFCRLEDSRRRGIQGMGLGLSIAARLAEAFGADLTVTSLPLKRTTFCLSFSRQ